jgi:hypothetical protein
LNDDFQSDSACWEYTPNCPRLEQAVPDFRNRTCEVISDAENLSRTESDHERARFLSMIMISTRAGVVGDGQGDSS